MDKLQTSLIKLAENPIKKSEDKDEDSMDYEEEDSSMDNKTDKGRSVSGPRTKLSNAAEEKFEKIENSISELAKAVHAIAKSNGALVKSLAGGGGGFPPMEEEADPMMMPTDEFGGDMGGGDEFGGGDELGEEGMDDLDLGAENMFGGNFAPYGGDQEAAMRDADVTMQKRPDQMVSMSKARLAKDDSSSNFGEKDSDIPGNRKLIPDDKEKSADEYLIQGGPSAGQSVNKALVDAVAKAVVSQLSSSRVAKSAKSPSTANSQISKGEEAVDTNALMESAVNKSFKELNRKRVELGLLSGGIL